MTYKELMDLARERAAILGDSEDARLLVTLADAIQGLLHPSKRDGVWESTLRKAFADASKLTESIEATLKATGRKTLTDEELTTIVRESTLTPKIWDELSEPTRQHVLKEMRRAFTIPEAPDVPA